MLEVVGNLQLTTSVRFRNGFLHRWGDAIGVHDNLSVNVSSSSADHLNERRLAAKETLFVGVENCHQTHLRQVQSLTQKIDTNQNIKLPETQRSKNFDPLNRVNV